LPFELKIEDLYKPHPSRPRNKLIAKVFYYFGYIEKWGSGIERILRALREYNLPEPRFEEVFGGFQVTFYRDVYTEEHLRELGLNERQIKAALYVKEKGGLQIRSIRSCLKFQDRRQQEILVFWLNWEFSSVLKKAGIN